MTLYPWRLQGDIKMGETDPMVTVFLGQEVAVVDADGNATSETAIYQNTNNPAVMKLSELVTTITDPIKLMAARPKPPLPAASLTIDPPKT